MLYQNHIIITQVATYMILDLQTPFLIQNRLFYAIFVAQTVSLRTHKLNLTDNATSVEN